MTTTVLTPREASWAERGATWTVFLTLGIAAGAWAATLPALKSLLSLSDRDLSFALLAVSGGSVGSTVLAGLVAPRIGTGRATMFGVLALAVAIALPGFARSLPQLVCLALVFGVANGFLDVSMNGHASEVERRWGRAIMSSFHGAFSLGGLIGAAFGGLLATAGFGPQGQLLLPALLVACLALGSVLHIGAGARSEPNDLGLAWPERAVWGLCLISMLCLIVEGAMADWSGVYLATVVRVSDGVAATGYAAFSLTMTIGRVLGDRIVRALGPRVVVIGGAAITVLGLGASVAIPALVPSTLGFALVGLGLSNIAPVVFSAAGRFGRTPAAGMAMVVSVGYIGFVSGPPMIGAVASVFDLRIALGFLTLIAGVIVVAGFWLRTEPGRAG